MANCARCGHAQEAHEDITDGAGELINPNAGTCMWTQSHPSPEPCGCPNFTNRLPKQPIRGARLNAKYCLVKLTYLQAQQLFQAASQMEDDARMNPKDIGWTGAEAKALKEALDKLRETSERWPQGMDV